ncbi:MAG: alpha/beta fold hydrolase [Streptosporangiales bacterium]|nr:alpha/beta fold hydrolase [Streptosporangiales bacterium]
MGDPIPPWPGESADLGGIELFVRSAPPADPATVEPAVFVHGLGGGSTNWTDLMDELTDLLDGDAPDLPGFGHSPVPKAGDYSIDGHAAAVTAWIEARGRGPVHLFGNSMGGAVATRIAAERPELVRTLTLVSPALPDLRPRMGPYRMPVVLVPRAGPWVLDKVLARPPEERVQGMLDMCYSDPSRVPAQRLMEAVQEMRRQSDLDHVADALSGSIRGLVVEYLRRGPRALWRQAAKVRVPTLVLYGRDDRLVDPRMAGRAGRVFRRSRVVVLPRAGHVAQMELPRTVAREFRALLEDLDGRE